MRAYTNKFGDGFKFPIMTIMVMLIMMIPKSKMPCKKTRHLDVLFVLSFVSLCGYYGYFMDILVMDILLVAYP